MGERFGGMKPEGGHEGQRSTMATILSHRVVMGSHFLLLENASRKSRPHETERYVEVMD